jgi:phosphinothricin acetyltransferase
MPQGMRVRAFEAADAGRVAEIYNQGIADRNATFETEPRSAERLSEEFAAGTGRFPVVVVERDGTILAAAWASQYRPRSAYGGVAEFSVYVAREERGRGAGRLALGGLLEAAQERGFWKLVSRIFPENIASRRLCQSLGFREVGVYRRHGKLDGAWRDCVIVERLLEPRSVT